MSVIEKRRLVETHPQISLVRQCQLLGLARSVYYYQPTRESDYNLELMRRMDEQYMGAAPRRTPYYGVRLMYGYLRRRLGYPVNVKRVRRLYRKMGLEAITPKPNLSKPNAEHKVYPYLLRHVTVERVNQVWSTDITYMPMRQGFLYLTAVMDWYSRCVLSWELSNSLDVSFCLAAVKTALATHGKPEIFNTDQGSQFTSGLFTGLLLDNAIQVSMDGKGHRGADELLITLLSSDFGEVLNMTISIYACQKVVWSYTKDYRNTLKNIIMIGLILHWIIAHQPKYISVEKKYVLS